MNTARLQLETSLKTLADVTIDTYRDTDLVCVYYKGRKIAHFHDAQEIDVRVPRKFARAHGLGEPLTSARHPNRSKNSIWRIFRFFNEDEVAQLVALFDKLIEAEYAS